MQTLTVTKARANLGHWLKRAARGEEIGIIVGGQIIALRPVPVVAADYMEQEYGLTTAEADRAAARVREDAASARESGDYVPFDSLLHASPRRPQKRRRRAAKARA